MKIVSIRCPETSVANYLSTLRNIPEDRRPQLRGCGSPKSQTASDSKLNHEDIAVRDNKIARKQSDIKSWVGASLQRCQKKV